MPRRDTTGPMGLGPRTGWGMGPCGMGRGRGFARGFRYVQPVSLSKEEERQMLEADLKNIESEKQAVIKRLEELK